MRNIRLTIAYDGTNFHGWQRQPDKPTIQGEIERHLVTIHNRPITLHGAGRTDAGVHALGMVANFLSDRDISCEALRKSLNSMLVPSIRILAVDKVAQTFHSRFSAVSKTYRYTFFNGTILMPRKRLYTAHITAPLDINAMDACLHFLIGTHDFASFETAGSRDPRTHSPRGSTRTILDAAIIHNENHIYSITLTGDGFLRHMVRNIAGTLFEVGAARRAIADFKEVVAARHRSAAGPTAPAHGLTLETVHYLCAT
ncbi:MAG: tRNA pseudouridine(38-40) synthase TruA [Desulfopila sp.]